MRNEKEVMNGQAEETEKSSESRTFTDVLKAWNWKKIALVAGILAVIYIGVSLFFQSHFYFRSSVNGISSSAASATAVADKLTETGKKYTLTIVDENGKKETITPADIGLSVDADKKDIEELLKKQNGFAWPKYVFVKKNYTQKTVVAFDEDKLNQKVSNLSVVKNTDVTKTEDATYQYTNGKFSVKKEVYGNNVDTETFTKQISDAIMHLDKKLDMKADKAYVQPTVTADSSDLKKLVKEMNDQLAMSFTYDMGDAKEEVSKDTMASFLAADDQLNMTYNQDAISAFIKGLANKYNTFGKTKSLATQYGQTVTVPGGNYGWKIDVAGETAQFVKDLKAKKDVSRDFVYKYKAASHGANDYGNSYVEVNLTAQHVYLIVNGACVMDTPCVTGNVSKGNGTPAGAFRITYCEKDATLKGANYESKVGFWMPFNGGIGLHDATWRSVFGGTIYKKSGSHGCVNLPLSAAKTIFGYVKTGFPVLCYTLPGTEDNSTEKAAAKTVSDKITAIGTVTTASAGAIADARASYNALSADEQALVTNYSALTAAEASLAAQQTQAQQAAQAGLVQSSGNNGIAGQE